MESIKSIIKSNYKGSTATAKMVAEEIARRYGEAEVKNYDPYYNCLTFKQWLANNFRVKRGERAIPSITYVDRKDEHGEVISTYPKRVNLFYYLQVEPIN
ncbi:MAG: hypothetical protein Q7K65_02385 [Candidatus Buchananbacteria bacterium]|nr:hypothetical protein [Candidatus Buchananbacteria bacterium]